MDSLFYCDIERNYKTEKLIEDFRQYSKNNFKQVFIIKKALGDSDKYEYSYDDAAIVLIPKHKIILVNYGQECKEFEDFYSDFTEDLGHLSDRYEYKKILGRPREWKQLVLWDRLDEDYAENYSDLWKSYEISNRKEERKVDLLISLLIGSINDIEKVGLTYPDTILDKVKQKIILFDGMQSRFIYEQVNDKRVLIQGLAGTGKTELLLHKLRKNYVEKKDSRIAFTCFNKVLAEDMKNRIPQFFNFMKVDEQIEWWKRLWVFPSWGSQSLPFTGMYSYICVQYGLSFKRYSLINSFDKVCGDAIEQLKSKGEIVPCFDYVFIDESQDFSQSFFELCQLVTKEQVYIAGDIFQNIFDVNILPSVDCHYLLNKCYRTDPHTLMFAHSVGMGLFEQPVIRWLEDEEWNACGYNIVRNEKVISLSREKIRRFEDIEMENFHSVILKISNSDQYVEVIMECIDEIRQDNPTVVPDDIAIVFLSNSKLNYSISDALLFHLSNRYDWDACQGYITKTKEKNKLFISNVNNIKGLEFPFVICVCTEIVSSSIQQRNSMYMILTRSFLNSYFVVNSQNDLFIQTYQKAIYTIENNNCIVVEEPSEEEKKLQSEKIKIAVNAKGTSVEDIINEVIKEYEGLSKKHIDTLYSSIPNIIENETEEEIVSKVHGMIKVFLGN